MKPANFFVITLTLCFCLYQAPALAQTQVDPEVANELQKKLCKTWKVVWWGDDGDKNPQEEDHRFRFHLDYSSKSFVDGRLHAESRYEITGKNSLLFFEGEEQGLPPTPIDIKKLTDDKLLVIMILPNGVKRKIMMEPYEGK